MKFAAKTIYRENVHYIEVLFLKGFFITFTAHCKNLTTLFDLISDHPKLDAQISTQDPHCEGG